MYLFKNINKIKCNFAKERQFTIAIKNDIMAFDKIFHYVKLKAMIKINFRNTEKSKCIDNLQLHLSQQMWEDCFE